MPQVESKPPQTITITIEGPDGLRKSLIAEIIQEALLDHGCPVIPDPAHGKITPRVHRSVFVATWDAAGVRIVERAADEPYPQQVQTSHLQWCCGGRCRGCDGSMGVGV